MARRQLKKKQAPRPRRARRRALVALAGAALVAWALTRAVAADTSAPVAKPVPFDRLASGESTVPPAAAVQVAADRDAAAALAGRLGRPDLAGPLSAVDFALQRVVAVFVGPVPSSGHGVQVLAVSAQAGAGRIAVSLTRPAPGQNTNDVVSYPYAIVAVPRALDAPVGSWRVTGPDGAPLRPR